MIPLEQVDLACEPRPAFASAALGAEKRANERSLGRDPRLRGRAAKSLAGRVLLALAPVRLLCKSAQLSSSARSLIMRRASRGPALRARSRRQPAHLAARNSPPSRSISHFPFPIAVSVSIPFSWPRTTSQLGTELLRQRHFFAQLLHSLARSQCQCKFEPRLHSWLSESLREFQFALGCCSRFVCAFLPL